MDGWRVDIELLPSIYSEHTDTVLEGRRAAGIGWRTQSSVPRTCTPSSSRLTRLQRKSALHPRPFNASPVFVARTFLYPTDHGSKSDVGNSSSRAPLPSQSSRVKCFISIAKSPHSVVHPFVTAVTSLLRLTGGLPGRNASVLGLKVCVAASKTAPQMYVSIGSGDVALARTPIALSIPGVGIWVGIRVGWGVHMHEESKNDDDEIRIRVLDNDDPGICAAAPRFAERLRPGSRFSPSPSSPSPSPPRPRPRPCVALAPSITSTTKAAAVSVSV
ncbi:hypothetical protein B0H11DRAFT_2286762, partial [Mycena galericulata]